MCAEREPVQRQPHPGAAVEAEPAGTVATITQRTGRGGDEAV